jgi:hypothetical protein
MTSYRLAELMPYEIGAMARVTSEKLLWDVVDGDGRIDAAGAGREKEACCDSSATGRIDAARALAAASVLRQLGHRPDWEFPNRG